ncbi:abortive phage resistance protein [Rubellimicrobium mesophilum DSM 19309]|uniref:Abortive phage resistance protein n=1 Tax=Rubellimicrobium mesophilum DSM 19309 TaxID=442562 RepID=A0A017HPK0_9RHOB|nr:hypothetical protein [Rubellimicrobium mesophilum]EYD76048.1 abortive phage resistance protein [Rubellimicrobium mesophilum DSM 19309]
MSLLPDPDLPTSKLDRVRTLESILIDAATGGSHDDSRYPLLRREVLTDPELRDRIPDFVRQYRTLKAFWPFIRDAVYGYAGRRQFLTEAFTPLIDDLENPQRSPSDRAVSGALTAFNAAAVEEAWTKALARRTTDPEGAITAATTLLNWPPF